MLNNTILLFCRIKNAFLQPVASESSLRPGGWELLLLLPREETEAKRELSPVLGSQSRSESRTLTLGPKLFSKSPLGLGILNPRDPVPVLFSWLWFLLWRRQGWWSSESPQGSWKYTWESRHTKLSYQAWLDKHQMRDSRDNKS